MAANALPGQRYDPSGAFYSRMIQMRCPNELADEDINPQLEEAVIADEMPAVLNWALKGLADLHDQNWKYTIPGYAAAQAERAWLDANHHQDFFNEAIREAERQFLDQAELGRAYKKWVKGQPVKALSAAELYAHLDDHLKTLRVKIHGRPGWQGYRHIINLDARNQQELFG